MGKKTLLVGYLNIAVLKAWQKQFQERRLCFHSQRVQSRGRGMMVEQGSSWWLRELRKRRLEPSWLCPSASLIASQPWPSVGSTHMQGEPFPFSSFSMEIPSQTHSEVYLTLAKVSPIQLRWQMTVITHKTKLASENHNQKICLGTWKFSLGVTKIVPLSDPAFYLGWVSG